jgi:hypothetical protein
LTINAGSIHPAAELGVLCAGDQRWPRPRDAPGAVPVGNHDVAVIIGIRIWSLVLTVCIGGAVSALRPVLLALLIVVRRSSTIRMPRARSSPPPYGAVVRRWLTTPTPQLRDLCAIVSVMSSTSVRA